MFVLRDKEIKINQLVMKQMIEEYLHEGKGYDPCLIREPWQAALLNYAPEQGPERIDKMEKHVQTDEVFVLLGGRAVLIAAEITGDTVRFATKLLEEGIIYNIPKTVWHNIAMDRDARIFICENAGTHLHDCTYHPLTAGQRDELCHLLKALFK
jgi:mannose-6-phosphate isomerase-like protein (cupin superfamily)